MTDHGKAFIKTLGGPEGPHPLACEWVGTQIAKWFGLPTFDFALMSIDTSVTEIPFFGGGFAQTGTAFVTKATIGHNWGGDEDELETLVNPEAVTRLVIFDTWTLNEDRCPPDGSLRQPNYDNVFLEDLSGADAGKTRLTAMDQGSCFSSHRELTKRIARIDRIQDDRVYGLYSAFTRFVCQDEIETATARLKELDRATVESVVESVPKDWNVSPTAREALCELIIRRADYVSKNALTQLRKKCWPGQLFDH